MSRFINNLKRRVAKEQKKIVLPESESRRVLQAAERVQAEGFARPILIGRPQSIVEVASEYQIDMDGIEIIDPETYPMMDKFCQYYAKRRAKKGMSLEEPGKSCQKITSSLQPVWLPSILPTAWSPVRWPRRQKSSGRLCRSSVLILVCRRSAVLSS